MRKKRFNPCVFIFAKTMIFRCLCVHKCLGGNYCSATPKIEASWFP